MKVHVYTWSVGSASWGASVFLYKTWYKSVIERIILYAAEVWGVRLTDSNPKRLRSTQTVWLLKVLRCYRTSFIDKISVWAEVKPINLAVKSNALFFPLLRLRILSSIIANIDDFDYPPKSEFYNSQAKFITYNLFPGPSVWGIYTDGSSHDNTSGFSICIFHRNILWKTCMYKINTSNSVFQAEFTDIFYAVR